MLRLWNRLINMENTRTAKKTFLNHFRNNKTPWYSEIKSIFYDLKMETFIIQKSSCDLHLVEQKLYLFI